MSCFDMPVQANQRNIREFKEYLNKLETQNIANFSSALTEAFELLQRVSTTETLYSFNIMTVPRIFAPEWSTVGQAEIIVQLLCIRTNNTYSTYAKILPLVNNT